MQNADLVKKRNKNETKMKQEDEKIVGNENIIKKIMKIEINTAY